MAPRSTCAGSHEDLAEILKKHALVADFVDYPEPTTSKTKVKLDVAKIMKAKSLFAELLALQPNMAFQKRKIDAAVEKVWKDCWGKWARKPRADRPRRGVVRDHLDQAAVHDSAHRKRRNEGPVKKKESSRMAEQVEKAC